MKVEFANEGCMHMEVVRLPDEATEGDVVEAIHAPGAQAVIVQLPLPREYDTIGIVNQIPEHLDADVLSERAYARFEKGEADALIPPVGAAVLEVVRHIGIAMKGKKTVVVGRGRLVGRPVATVLSRLGAEVTVVSKETPEEERRELYKRADVLVSGAGAAHSITPELITDGVVLIDAGTSGTGGNVSGDIHPDCAKKASYFTPVPGGVGPIAVSCLFRNTALLVARNT
jgi:methylenetetrahydrofolate dehydrogenase (NADP+)/methenyltetrahydrofolate cyclohydrolase